MNSLIISQTALQRVFAAIAIFALIASVVPVQAFAVDVVPPSPYGDTEMKKIVLYNWILILQR